MTLLRQGTIIRQRILFHMLNLFIGKQKNAYHLQKGKVTSFIIYEALSWLKFIFIGLDVRSWCFIMFPKSHSAFWARERVITLLTLDLQFFCTYPGVGKKIQPTKRFKGRNGHLGQEHLRWRRLESFLARKPSCRHFPWVFEDNMERENFQGAQPTSAQEAHEKMYVGS